jgi:hypothetical protein
MAWKDHVIAHVVLFHSMLGLRPVELRAADRLRAAGHQVVTPDLYAGETASTLDEGFALKDDRIGWTAIGQRAHDAVRDLPAETVLAGISISAGVVHTLLPRRPDAAGVLLLHGLAAIPATARDGLPVQLHVSDADDFAPPRRGCRLAGRRNPLRRRRESVPRTRGPLILPIISRMLSNARIEARIPTQDLARARSWYAEKLGLEPVEERAGGLRYEGAAGVFCLFASAGASDGSFTQMGFYVDDVEAAVGGPAGPRSGVRRLLRRRERHHGHRRQLPEQRPR